jgi:hypothetical protein
MAQTIGQSLWNQNRELKKNEVTGGMFRMLGEAFMRRKPY